MPEKPKKPKQSSLHGKPRISVKFYEDLVQAYRDNPSNHAAAAKQVGCARKTAKRGWDFGWPKFDWAPPISTVMDEEDVLARARIAREYHAEEAKLELGEPTDSDQINVPALASNRRQAHLDAQAERALAKENAINAKAEEGKMVQATRSAVLQSEAALLRIGAGVNLLADRVNKELTKMAKKQGKFEIGSALTTIRKYATAVRDITQAAGNSLELERLHLGEPGKIIGVAVSGTFDDAPMEDLVHEIRKAAEAFEDAEARGFDLKEAIGDEANKAVH